MDNNLEQQLNPPVSIQQPPVNEIPQSKSKFKLILLIVILLLAVGAGAYLLGTKQNNPSQQKVTKTSPSPETGGIGYDAIWLMSPEAITELSECPEEPITALYYSSTCVVPIMERYGATKEAINFFEKTHYWFLIDFKEMGKVDLAKIFTPWKANDNDQWALVNGSPQIIDVGKAAADFVNPPQKTMNHENLSLLFSTKGSGQGNFEDLFSTLPRYTLWPGGGTFIKQESESFLFYFNLKDERGCHTCDSRYNAVVSFDFKNGNYTGQELLDFCTKNIHDERFSTCDFANRLQPSRP